MRRLNIFIPRTIFYLFFAFCCSLFAVYCYSETIDRIVAVVNDEVITLTDIRIVETFGLYEAKAKGQTEKSRMLILESLINQKLVIQLASEKIAVEEKEVESLLEDIKKRIGFDRIQEELAGFGLDGDDLREYIREKILYQGIISRKFKQSIVVSLNEIETYYKQKYVPSYSEKDLEPQPMMEILDEIESAIRQDKIKKQVEDWIKNLKRQADIQIKIKS